MERKFKILVPLDGSRESLRAAKYAVNMTKMTNSSLTFLNVISAPSLLIGKGALERFYDEASKTARKALEKEVDHARKQGVEADADVVKGADSDTEGIVDYAKKKNIDLIIISRGGYGRSSYSMGSVSSAVSYRAHCPVLLVK